jgi:DNA-binding IclR family transcriptional regulator
LSLTAQPNTSRASANSSRRETSSDKTLSIMDLFTSARPEWTIEAMAAELHLSTSTVYRYVRSLMSAGLVLSVRPGRYLLGPGIVHYERQLRLADPLIRAAQPILRNLAGEFPPPGVLFIGRAHHGHVMSMLEQSLGFSEFATSYDRGRFMPLYRGAPALAILAHQPIRNLKRGFLNAHHDSPDAAESWRQLKRQLRITRSQGYSLDAGTIDGQTAYISVPLLQLDGGVAGSLTLGLPLAAVSDSPEPLAATLRHAAQRISAAALPA